MVYVTKTGSEVSYRRPPKPLMKSLSLTLMDRKTYSSNQLLDVIFRYAGHLCEEVVFDHSFVHPDGSLSHTYNLFFSWGRFGSRDYGSREINEIVAEIEDALPSHIPVSVRGRSHRRPQRMSNETQV